MQHTERELQSLAAQAAVDCSKELHLALSAVHELGSSACKEEFALAVTAARLASDAIKAVAGVQ